MKTPTLFEHEPEVYTVTSLTTKIASIVRASLEEPVILKGEISNYKRHSSGHIYFTLKDKTAQINAIIWSSTSARLPFQLEDGLEILVEGKIDFYPPSGRYQIICQKAKPIGEGFLQKEFEKLFKKLSDEGLFNEDLKKELPTYPETIGVITASTGAVIEDIRSVFFRRYPAGKLILYPVAVQGDLAPMEIAEAIAYFNTTKNKIHTPDLLIVGRGGGSLEDLWAFNTEVVARAIFNSHIPIISAVGHEVNYSISDYVADVRAGTPSIAAEFSSPPMTEIYQSVQNTTNDIGNIIKNKIHLYYEFLDEVFRRSSFYRPKQRLEYAQQQFTNDYEKIISLFKQKFNHIQEQHEIIMKKIDILSIDATLKRGFAIIKKNDKMITRSSQLKSKDIITILFLDGEKTSVVE